MHLYNVRSVLVQVLTQVTVAAPFYSIIMFVYVVAYRLILGIFNPYFPCYERVFKVCVKQCYETQQCSNYTLECTSR